MNFVTLEVTTFLAAEVSTSIFALIIPSPFSWWSYTLYQFFPVGQSGSVFKTFETIYSFRIYGPDEKCETSSLMPRIGTSETAVSSPLPALTAQKSSRVKNPERHICVLREFHFWNVYREKTGCW
jgi:hypothetical protein